MHSQARRNGNDTIDDSFHRVCASAWKMAGAMRGTFIAGCIVSLAATMLPSISSAMTWQQCFDAGQRCIAGCDGRPIGKDICVKRCSKTQENCMMYSKDSNHTSPTGGTKADPQKPPKVNDTRPPVGGGVFHPRTSDAGTSGSSLKSSATSGGPNLRSGGRN